MNALILLLISLAAFPFLFPDEFLYWSTTIRGWLDEREREREREAANVQEKERETLERVEQALRRLRQELASVNREQGGPLCQDTQGAMVKVHCLPSE